MKKERDIIDVPFETTEIYCNAKAGTNELENQNAVLKEEKEQLINNLIAAKEENQKLYIEVKSKQQIISACDDEKNRLQFENSKQQKVIAELTHKQQTIVSAHEGQQHRFQEELSKQQKIIVQLSHENKNSQAKIKQLMATTSVERTKEVNSTVDEKLDEYEVQAILNHTIKRGQRTFLIRWKGYSSNVDTWEKECHLNCPQILKKYLKSKGL